MGVKQKTAKNESEQYRDHNTLKKFTIIVPVILYFIFYYCTRTVSDSESVIIIGGNALPVATFAGVFASVSGICLVVMVLQYRKFGFFVALMIILFQLPVLLLGIFLRKTLQAIPGVFNSIFTILMLVIVMAYQLKMEKEQKRLEKMFDDTATTLVNAIDAKDIYTSGHSSRVAHYSKKLAQMNGKSEKECNEIYYAALLHDVGKIGVPSSIINKEGKLTYEEFNIVRMHPRMGAQILENISEYPYLSIGAGYHHERYDGSGYPYGLKGEDIPELARIISVADAYDAMTSIRSYRDPIPQDRVREEVVKGIGTQFDPHYARLMLHLIDVDTEYEMQERARSGNSSENRGIVVGLHRSAVADGILINSHMTTVSMLVNSDDETAGITPSPSIILFDSADGLAHLDDEMQAKKREYFEYGEIWFNGRTETKGARKIQSRIERGGSPSIKHNGEYRIEAVRIKDHALIRILGKKHITEAIAALPDSTRFMYIGLTGEHCSLVNLEIEISENEYPDYHIPRIAESISYINVPEGDIPNVQIDGYRTDASEGIEVKDGLKIQFHTKSLPTARLVWHCPFINLFCSDDAKVNGENYRDLALARFDGECWESDPGCTVELNVNSDAQFGGWDDWKEYNLAGYDATVTFKVDGNRITIITENAGISVRNTAIMTGIDRKIYAAVTGDQVAITNIRIKK